MSEAQATRLEPYFPKSHGMQCVDDLRVQSEIVLPSHDAFRPLENV